MVYPNDGLPILPLGIAEPTHHWVIPLKHNHQRGSVSYFLPMGFPQSLVVTYLEYRVGIIIMWVWVKINQPLKCSRWTSQQILVLSFGGCSLGHQGIDPQPCIVIATSPNSHGILRDCIAPADFSQHWSKVGTFFLECFFGLLCWLTMVYNGS